MPQLRNSTSRYGLVSIILHWVAAVAILAMLATAVAIMIAPNEEVQTTRIQLHVWTGTSLYLIIAARIIWSWRELKPVLLSTSPMERSLARFVHMALLLLIALQLVTGPLGVWSGGWPVGAFELFSIPSPFEGPQIWHEAIGEVHSFTGLAIAFLLAMHLAGVFKHSVITRDRTLSRMLGIELRDAKIIDRAAQDGAAGPVL